MALVKKTTALIYGEITLNPDGTFKNVDGYKDVGIWDDILNDWAQPPERRVQGSYTLQQFKNFVSSLA